MQTEVPMAAFTNTAPPPASGPSAACVCLSKGVYVSEITMSHRIVIYYFSLLNNETRFMPHNPTMYKELEIEKLVKNVYSLHNTYYLQHMNKYRDWEPFSHSRSQHQ